MIKKILFMLCWLPCVVIAQRPVVLIVPFGAGGPADQVAKVIQKTLGQELDQSVVIEYKPGAGGAVANAYVASWNRPETVLLLQSSALATNLALNNTLFGSLNLTPIVHIGSMPLLLAVSKKSNLDTWRSWQTANPQRSISWGSAGIGSSSHIYGEVFKHKIQKNLNHIPYKGIAQIMPDLISGTLDAAFIFASTAEPFVRANQIVPIAVASGVRLKNLPTVPTFAELGLTGMDYYSWFVLLTNQNTSTTDQQKIQQAMIKILSNKSQSQLFQQVGLEVHAYPVTSAFISREVHRYQEVIKTLNLKTQ